MNNKHNSLHLAQKYAQMKAVGVCVCVCEAHIKSAAEKFVRLWKSRGSKEFYKDDCAFV